VLLGGWAVYAYNPYIGSFDIDCLGPIDLLERQLNIYMSTNGYVLEPESSFGSASESWVKIVTEGATRIGEIRIDACDFEFPNRFTEDPSKILPYSLCTRSAMIQRRTIDGASFYVPIKELLFLYKVKAARDRDYLIRNGSLTGQTLEWYQGKRDKDYSDLVALLDPGYGALDGSHIRDIIHENSLSFIVDTLPGLHQQSGVEGYCARRSVTRSHLESWTRRLLTDSGLRN